MDRLFDRGDRSGKIKLSFSNRAYAKRWFKNLRRQSPGHFTILRGIIREVERQDGGEITKASLYERFPAVAELCQRLGLDPIPSRGQMLKHNGNGIRHAKFSPSKSIAVVWEKIDETIYFTFDDHAPIRYHRAISHLRDIKLGRPALPKRSRTAGWFYKLLRRSWQRGYQRKLRGFDPKRRWFE